jgi:hypothetical protein
MTLRRTTSPGCRKRSAGRWPEKRWLVVSEQVRGKGTGRALVADAMRRFVTGPGTVEVVTFEPSVAW